MLNRPAEQHDSERHYPTPCAVLAALNGA